ncbi:MAG TPA: LPS assembly lipoprotein LptE [Rhodocyclaceae bacterium]|nr:LPS assembly lipoprotein LptE [Rhodocyclaceae bacterium]
MRALLALLCVSLLTACGFQLRGNYDLPFDSLYISLPESSQLHAVLKRSIEASSKTRVSSDSQTAQALLTVIADQQAKNILSLNSSGRVREYQLVRSFTFRVHDIGGRDFVPQATIVIRRDMTFSDDQVLAKESEEALLWRDMQTDLVQQVMRRLSKAKVSEPTVEGNAVTR